MLSPYTSTFMLMRTKNAAMRTSEEKLITEQVVVKWIMAQ